MILFSWSNGHIQENLWGKTEFEGRERGHRLKEFVEQQRLLRTYFLIGNTSTSLKFLSGMQGKKKKKLWIGFSRLLGVSQYPSELSRDGHLKIQWLNVVVGLESWEKKQPRKFPQRIRLQLVFVQTLNLVWKTAWDSSVWCSPALWHHSCMSKCSML